MGYRNIKPILAELESFRYQCGLYDLDSEEDWVCKSKNRTKEQGVCLSFECPLASEAGLDDLKKHDKALYEEHKKNFKKELEAGQPEEECVPSADYGSHWMIQYRQNM